MTSSNTSAVIVGADIVVNSTYAMRVLATSAAGVGPAPNKTILCTAGPEGIPQPPTGIVASEITSSTAFVSWEAPSDFGGAQNSTVWYVVISSLPGEPLILVPESGSAQSSHAVLGRTQATKLRVHGLLHSSAY